MVITIWEVKRSLITSVRYSNGDICRILTLRTPFPSDLLNDKEELEKLNSAVEIVNKFIASSVKCKGCGGERFLNINNANIMERKIDALQHEIIGELILRFIREPDKINQGWVGTMSELYKLLYVRLGSLGISYDQKQFPKSHIALAKRINAIVLNLKAVVIIEKCRDRRNDGKVERLVKITYVER